MKPLRSFGSLTALLSLAALLFIVSCHRGDGSSDAPPLFSARLVKSVDAVDLEKRLKAELTRRYERQYTSSLYWGNSMGGGDDLTVAGGESQPPTSDPTMSGGSADTSYSETNVQERGVDEGDLVKTDGAYIYLARGTHFFVLKANPAVETALVSDIDLSEPINELYLANNLVTVITASYSYPVMTGTAGSVASSWYGPVTRLYTYDVSTAAAPTLTASIDFPGTLRGSRRINTALYLVINHTIDIPSPVSLWDYLNPGSFYDRDAYMRAREQALAENLKRIEEATLDDLLPAYTVTLSTAGTPSASPAISYDGIYIPEFGNGTDLSLVVRLDIAGRVPAITATSGVLSSWCSVYMSPESLYLTSDNHWWWIEPMVGVDMPPANPEPRTAVHKFSVAGPEGNPLYKGSAEVDGWVNDRFSMSDYEGNLRIGTTRGGWWGEGISNQLAVLSEGDGKLVEVGKLTGLAPGERIYSMRFDRDRGYMVTFRRTDPLFTLDLRDPANPQVAGELIVNGFSTYIHLLGTDRLLTIGRSADTTGRVTGNKLQIFDVSDLAAPALLDAYELGTGWSDALYDPHAFLYYEPLGILAIPHYSNGATFDSYATGLNVFNIDPAGSITLRGIISAATVTGAYGGYSYNYLDTVDRSVIISSGTGTSIYALAHRSVTVAGADQLNIIKTVVLPESYFYYGPVGMGL